MVDEPKKNYPLKAETGRITVTGQPVGMHVLKLGNNPVANTAAIIADAVRSPGQYTFIERATPSPELSARAGDTGPAAGSSQGFKWALIIVGAVTILCIIGVAGFGLGVGDPTASQKTTMLWLEGIATTGFGAFCGLLGGKLS
jgi:hypothetical protein